MSSLTSSPFSSPSSSPSLDAVDSSPPSSPTLVPLSSSPISPGPSHPFAGSTKAVKPLPLYEKRGTKRPRAHTRWGDQVDSDVELQDVFVDDTPPRRVDRSKAGWDPDVRAHAKPFVLSDPFAASAKQEWVPPVREKKVKTHSRSTSGASSVKDVFVPPSSSALQDAFVYHPPPTIRSLDHRGDSDASDIILATSPIARRTRRASMNSEHRRWDDAISSAIAEANGIIDLSASGVLGTVLTHIPSSIGDLANLVLLRSEESNSVLHPTSRRPETPEPVTGCNPHKRVFVRSLTVPSCQPGQSIFDYSPPRTASKSNSSVHIPLIVATKQVREMTEVQLLLEKNTISRLPLELFSVLSLTVLNLRSNMLRRVPPQIAQLINLKELNVKNNKLKYLPADMLGMRLQVLELDHNPWLTPRELVFMQNDSGKPTGHRPRSPLSQQERKERIVSETNVRFTVAPLAEYCMRVLLAPHQADNEPLHSSSLTVLAPSGPSSSATTLDLQMAKKVQAPPWPQYLKNLEAYHKLPLSSHDGYPPHILDALRACLPDSVARPDTRTHVQGHLISPGNHTRQTRPLSVHEEIFSFAPPDLLAGLRTPPQFAIPPVCNTVEAVIESETGEGQTEGAVDAGVGVCPSPRHVPRNSRVFVRHAEERFSWEAVVACVEVSPKGGIPVLWRGCSPGCLQFLDLPDEVGEETDMDITEGDASVEECAEDMDIDFDMADSQSENGFGVDVMDLSGALDDFD